MKMGMSQGLGLTCHCTLNGICLFSVRGGFLVLSFIIEVSLMSIGIEELREECVYFQCISVSEEHYVVVAVHGCVLQICFVLLLLFVFQ